MNKPTADRKYRSVQLRESAVQIAAPSPRDTFRVRLVSPRELSAAELSAWSDIQQANDALDSPFLRPEFTQAVDAVRSDVEVGILENDGRPIGFFPFQRCGENAAQAVGGRLSDLQAVIVAEETHWSALELLRGCGLRTWYFDHLIQSQQPLQQFHWNQVESPCLDLRDGFLAYCEHLRSQRSQQLPQIMRKTRKLQREVGAVRLVVHSEEDLPVNSLFQWKSEQYRRTGRLDIFRYGWVVELLHRIRSMRTNGLRGMLSTLYAGNRIAAVHLGISSGRVLHWWFPAYNQELARYSPGLILLLELAKASESLGIKRIDLGKGDERYKASLRNNAILLAEGAVDLRPVPRVVWRKWHGLKRRIRTSRYEAALDWPLHVTRRLRQWMAFK